ARDAILIARNLGPAELLEYDRRRLKGVVLEEGSLTAHVTIVARAMGVPMIGRVADIRHVVNEGETILVNGDQGSVVVRPSSPMLNTFDARVVMSHKRRSEFAAIRHLPPVTKDGLRTTLMINA